MISRTFIPLHVALRTVAMFSLGAVCVAAPVHTTYLWHLEQPIYWPAPSLIMPGYETAWESIQHRNAGAVHPENDVAQIFSYADRVAAYQNRPLASIVSMTGVDAGAQVTYSGGLVRNVASLGAVNQLGYNPNWNTSFEQGRELLTSGGRPRLEMLVIPYHHCLAALVDREVLTKEIQVYQYLYPSVWGAAPPMTTGFFPPELAFSERIIPVLVECGISWSFVPSNHLARACANFPLLLGTGGENCTPPNRADQINPSSATWRTQTISRGCSPTEAVPFSLQPHRAKYINPESSAMSSVVVVPVAMAMSWQDGYQSYELGDVNSVAPHNDPAHPMLITLGHDGDNAYGGGYSYYIESVPNFTQLAHSAGYEPTTVPEFLADHPPAADDWVHVEDGAWINADGDFGDPDFINWNWPPHNASGQFDVSNGWAVDIRNWAIITAATNRVLTAEAIAGGSSIAAIQDPTLTAAEPQDLAWHFLLGSLNSGYMYYGNSLDMEVKPTIACNAAVDHADEVIELGGDPVPPTIWAVQQLPHNPGATGFGPLYGYQQVQHPRDFQVWSFVYDVSGVYEVLLKYRIDLDGVNPLSSHQNEIFAGGSEVTLWRSRQMARRVFPAGNVFNDPTLSFDVMPEYIADQYVYHVTDSEITDSGGVLVDYFLESVDSMGNVSRSDIYHTFVGTGDASFSDRVWWIPEVVFGGDTLVIFYDLVRSPLPPNTSPVHIHIGHSNWQSILNPDPAMTYDAPAEAWKYSYAVPVAATSVDFVFRSPTNQWDNNNGQDWHVSVLPSNAGFVMDGVLDGNAQQVATNGGVTLWAGFDGSELYIATERALGSPYDRFLFVASPPGNLGSAPWAKSGQVAAWSAFLAEESVSGWRGWFDAGGLASSAVGSVLEGTVNLAGEFGSLPARVHLVAARYATSDGGALSAQAPSPVIANGNIESIEWTNLALRPDSLTIRALSGEIALRWSTVLGATGYVVYRSPSADSIPSEVAVVPGTSYTDSPVQPSAFYVIRARF